MVNIRCWIGGIAAAVVINCAFWPVIIRFIKIGEMRLPYLLSVILLTAACGALIGKIHRQKVCKCIFGVVAGLASSFVALQIAKLFDRFGPLAAFRGVDYHSVMESWIVDAAITILLGGWLACFASALIFSRGRDKASSIGQQSTDFHE